MSSEAPLDEAYFHNVDHLETTEKQANKSVEGIRREQKVTTERDEFLDGIIPGVESTKQPTCSPQSSKQLKCTFSEDDMCTIYRTDGDKKEDRHHHHATLPGVALMGGGDDLEEAFLWMLMRCDGGHVVVLGASGEDGYNEWIMDLSRRNYKRAPVVSGVTTIICHHRDASELPRVLNILKDASCIFLKGGDQNLYIEYWMNTSIQRLLQDKVRVAPLGGTSAGLAVLGRYIFTAKHDTVSSENALQNPFDERVVLLGLKQSNALYYHSMFQEGESPSFLSIPFLENVLTDSHFCSRDRMGRMVAFLCRLRGEDGGGEDGGGEDGGGDGGGEDKGDDPEKEEPTTRRHLYEEHLGVCVDDATAIVLDVMTGIAVVMGKSLVNLVRLKRQDKKKNTPTTTTYRCEKDVPLTCTGIECLQLRPGDQYYFGNDRDGESGGVNENVWNDSIKLSVVDGHLFSVNPAKDYKKFENGDETAIDDTPNETTPTTTPMNPDLSKTQKLRREAILQLDNAAHTHFVKSLSNGKITLSRRGVIATATVSGGM
jgi:cyanophycinase-like exopeptidase